MSFLVFLIFNILYAFKKVNKISTHISENNSLIIDLVTSSLFFVASLVFSFFHFYYGTDFSLVLSGSIAIKLNSISAMYLILVNMCMFLVAVKSFHDRSSDYSQFLPVIVAVANIFVGLLAGDFFFYGYILSSLLLLSGYVVLGQKNGKGFRSDLIGIVFCTFSITMTSTVEKYISGDSSNGLLHDEWKILIFILLVLVTVFSFSKNIILNEDRFSTNGHLLYKWGSSLIQIATFNVVVYKWASWSFTQENWVAIGPYFFLLFGLTNLVVFVGKKKTELYDLFEGLIILSLLTSLSVESDLMIEMASGQLGLLFLLGIFKNEWQGIDSKRTIFENIVIVLIFLSFTGMGISLLPLTSTHFLNSLNVYFENNSLNLLMILIVLSSYHFFLGWRGGRLGLFSFGQTEKNIEKINLALIIVVLGFCVGVNYSFAGNIHNVDPLAFMNETNKLLFLLIVILLNILSFVLGYSLFSKMMRDNTFKGLYGKFDIYRGSKFKNITFYELAHFFDISRVIPSETFLNVINMVIYTWPNQILTALGIQFKNHTSKNIQSGLMYILVILGVIIYSLLLVL